MRIVTLLFLWIALLPGAHAAPERPLNGIASSYTIYVYPPRRPLDWSSPKRVLHTMLGNLADIAFFSSDNLIGFLNGFREQEGISANYKSSMGHTLNHLRCTTSDGRLYDHWASLSGQDFHKLDTKLLLKDKVGLGVLFYDYVDGHIISGMGNVKRITHYKGEWRDGERVRPRYIQIEITPQQCDEAKKMITFFEGFHFQPGTTLEQLEAKPLHQKLYFTNNLDPYDSYVARQSDPRARVGGGCAPFAAGLLKVTGHYLPSFDSLWRTDVTVSDALIGGWRDPHQGGAIRQVPVGELYFGPLGDHWRYQGYRDRQLHLYDPQRIWDFAGDVTECLRSGHCERGARSFLGEGRRAQLKVGATKVFRDSYEIPPANSEDSSRLPTVIEVEQPVDGFVWRLSR